VKVLHHTASIMNFNSSNLDFNLRHTIFYSSFLSYQYSRVLHVLIVNAVSVENFPASGQ